MQKPWEHTQKLDQPIKHSPFYASQAHNILLQRKSFFTWKEYCESCVCADTNVQQPVPAWSGAAAPEVQLPRARGSSHADRDWATHCTDPPCMDTSNVFPPANLVLLSQRGAWMRPHAAVLMWVLQVPAGAFPTAGPGTTEQQQLCLSHAAGSSMIYFLLTNTMTIKLLFIHI